MTDNMSCTRRDSIMGLMVKEILLSLFGHLRRYGVRQTANKALQYNFVFSKRLEELLGYLLTVGLLQGDEFLFDDFAERYCKSGVEIIPFILVFLLHHKEP